MGREFLNVQTVQEQWSGRRRLRRRGQLRHGIQLRVVPCFPPAATDDREKDDSTPTTKRLSSSSQASVPAVRITSAIQCALLGHQPIQESHAPFPFQHGLFEQLVCRNRNRIGQAKVEGPLHHLVLRRCPILLLNLWSRQWLHRLDCEEPQHACDVIRSPDCQSQPPASTHLVMATARLKP